MNIVAWLEWMVVGLALVAGIPAALYFLLPRSVWDAAVSHGRYTGLGR